MRQHRGRRSSLVKLVFFAAGLATLYLGYYAGNRYAPVKPDYLNLHLLAKPTSIALDLTDQYGNSFDHSQMLGYWNLVLFGYTLAPEKATTGLSLITQVKNRLAVEPELQSVTRAVFITLDPIRDTPEKLRTFIKSFSPDYLALTGSTGEIEAAARQLGVSIRHQPDSKNQNTRIDYGSSIGLIGPDAELIGLFTGVVNAVSIAADIQKLAADLPK